MNLGIPYGTFRRWVEIGDAELEGRETTEKWLNASKPLRKKCATLARALATAKSSLVKQCLASLRRKSLGDGGPHNPSGPWQIDAWLLERLYPGDFSLQSRVELSGAITVTICGEDLTDNEVSKFRRLLEPMLGILREEVTDSETLERIAIRIESVYGTGKAT